MYSYVDKQTFSMVRSHLPYTEVAHVLIQSPQAITLSLIHIYRNFLRLFPGLQYIIQVRKVNRGYAEESSSSAPIPHLIFRLIFASISTDTLIKNPLELLIKLVSSQLYLQPFHYIRKQPYACLLYTSMFHQFAFTCYISYTFVHSCHILIRQIVNL